MWTLYNMASMGSLRVEGGDERHYEERRVSSMENSEEESEEEKPGPKVVATEEKPKEFLEELKNSVKEKCKKAIDEKDLKLSTLLDKMQSNEEIRLLLTKEDYLKKTFNDNSGNALSDETIKDILKKPKAILLLQDPIETDLSEGDLQTAKGIAEKVKAKQNGKLSELLETFTQKELLLALTDPYKNAFVDCTLYKDDKNTGLSLTDFSIEERLPIKKIKATAFLTDPIDTDFTVDGEFETAKTITEKVKAKPNGKLSELLETFTQKELLLALTDPYKNAFVDCTLYKDDKNTGLSLNDFSTEERLPVKKIKAKAFLTDPIETDLSEGDLQTAKGIAEKVKAKQNGKFSELLKTFTQKELLLALTDPYKNAFVDCGLYKDDMNYSLDEKKVVNAIGNKILSAIKNTEELNKFEEELGNNIPSDLKTIIEQKKAHFKSLEEADNLFG